MDGGYSAGVVKNIQTGLDSGHSWFRFSWYDSDESAFLLVKKHFPSRRFYLYISGTTTENKTICLDFL
jgi:hypothetical protein